MLYVSLPLEPFECESSFSSDSIYAMAHRHSNLRNRTPLAELPVIEGDPVQRHSSPTPGATAATPHRNVLGQRLIHSPTANIPDSILTPTLSPQEIFSGQRGRRRLTDIWSSIQRPTPPSPMKTPTKNISTMTLRSSPRKRSLAQEFTDMSAANGFGSPSKRQLTARMSVGDSPGTSYPVKKPRLQETAMNRQNNAIPLETILKGHSREQLIGIISSLVAKNESLEAKVRQELPLPDIGPLDGELARIKKNIYASVPNQKFLSRTDGHGFLRAATHLATLKQTVHGQSQNLHSSRHWDALLDYVMMAWTHVRETPVYENDKHNATRRYCFKLLAHHASSALKHGAMGLGMERVARFQQKLPYMVADYAEIRECNRCIEHILLKGV
uniref:Uncharacterized protein n=1 Tax=Anopheles farauti TaxID=69004 RepID=A0A182Q343_9DIPT